MISCSPLLRGVALGALLVAGAGGQALAQAPADATTAELAAQIKALQAQVQALQARLDAQEADKAQAPVATQVPQPSAAAAPAPAPALASAAPAKPATTVEWKGAPEFSTPEGFRFKVRGRLQYDAGHVGNPEGALPGERLGFNSRVRRLRLGVEGWFPGDLQYKAEMDFANSAIGYGDVILFWQPEGKVYSFGVGNYDTFQNLEQPSSSRYISFLERAQFVEAFDHTRRLGAWTVLADPGDSWRLQLGVFNDRVRPDNAADEIEGSYGNDDWLLGGRALFTPRIGKDRLHVGVNYQRRRFQANNLNQTYRARPFTAITDQRFVSTGSIAAHGDEVMGIEAAAVLGRFHLTGEAQRLKVDAIRPLEVLGGGEASAGRRYNGDPVFYGWYVEGGVFLTGERRGYRAGLWDRTRVLHPVTEGGIGAIQLNVRYDVLDLDDRVSGTGLAAPDLVAGGRQTGLLFSTIWQPIDYVRFTLEYSRANVTGGPRAPLADPAAPPEDASFSSDQVLVRTQFDF